MKSSSLFGPLWSGISRAFMLWLTLFLLSFSCVVFLPFIFQMLPLCACGRHFGCVCIGGPSYSRRVQESDHRRRRPLPLHLRQGDRSSLSLRVFLITQRDSTIPPKAVMINGSSFNRKKLLVFFFELEHCGGPWALWRGGIATFRVKERWVGGYIRFSSCKELWRKEVVECHYVEHLTYMLPGIYHR